MNTTTRLTRFTRSIWLDLAVMFTVLFALFFALAVFGNTENPAPISDLPSAIPAPPTADTGSPFTVAIAVVTPLLIAIGKKLFPKLPGALLPFLAPVIGGVLDAGLRALDLHTDGLLTGLVSGSAGVGVHQAGKKLKRGVEGAPPTVSHGPLSLLILCSLGSLLFLTPGCMTREITRYTAEGKPWSTERLSTQFMRGEAANVREKVTEKGGGDYTRDVSIGSLRGEGEIDKLKELLGEVAERAASGAGKAVVP